MLAWLDLETTCLNPTHGFILEIATLITDDDLNVLHEGPSIVINRPNVAASILDSVVREMHTKNGLLADVDKSTCFLMEAVDKTIAFFLSVAPAEEWKKVPLAGSSVHFDRYWIKYWMSQLENMFSYRNVDVSSVKELCKRWAPAVCDGRPRGEAAHRALPDIYASIEELKYYRDNLFIKSTEVPRVEEADQTAG